MFYDFNNNSWIVTINLREDTNPRPPFLGLSKDKIITRFRSNY